MPRSIRVKLDPNPTAGDGVVDIVVGVEVSFAKLGRGLSKAKKDNPLPAKLTFHAAFLDVARGQAPRDPKRFATVEGTIELRGGEQVPVFSNGLGEDAVPLAISYDEPVPDASEATEDDDEPPRRSLQLAFNPSNFEDMLDPKLENTRLLLPTRANAEESLYMEITTELEIGGQLEAGQDLNDTLDVPLFNKEFVAVRVVDDEGTPVAGAKFLLTIPDGPSIGGVLDADGRMALFGLPPGECEFALADAIENSLVLQTENLGANEG
jgi:hypothetical protein